MTHHRLVDPPVKFVFKINCTFIIPLTGQVGGRALSSNQFEYNIEIIEIKLETKQIKHINV